MYARPLKALYVSAIDSFTQVDAFVDYSETLFKLDAMKIVGPMKEALRVFLASNNCIQAILIGARRTDPYSRKKKTSWNS